MVIIEEVNQDEDTEIFFCDILLSSFCFYDYSFLSFLSPYSLLQEQCKCGEGDRVDSTRNQPLQNNAPGSCGSDHAGARPVAAWSQARNNSCLLP